MPSVITITTDFGNNDAYVSCVKGVILTINPEAKVVDICHSIESQNIYQAAFILNTAYPYFPKDTIHVVIVDPGFGSQRNVVVLRTPAAFFMAPDNGVLSYILDEVCPESVIAPDSSSQSLGQKQVQGNSRAIVLTNPDYWRHPVSATFHGRDIFAPVAAHLSLGVPLDKFGETVNYLSSFQISRPYHDSKDNLIGCVLHVDKFGNLITNIKNCDFSGESVKVRIGSHLIHGLSRFYAEREGLAAIMGSSGYLEVSLTNGNASILLDVKAGEEVKLVAD